MLTCMDDLSNATSPAGPDGAAPAQDAAAPPQQQELQQAQRPQQRHVVVIGATNRPDALDPALRRAGRFDREIALGIPTEAARSKILRVITRNLRLEGDFDFARVAKRTPGQCARVGLAGRSTATGPQGAGRKAAVARGGEVGLLSGRDASTCAWGCLGPHAGFVGADLMALVKEAAALAVTRIFATLQRREQQELEGRQQQQQEAEQQQQQQQQQGAGQEEQEGAAPMQVVVAGAAGTSMEDAILAAAAAGREQEPGAAVVGEGAQRRFGAGPLQPSELEGLAISMADFEAAVGKVQPSVRREGFSTVPGVTWEDVGSLDEVRRAPLPWRLALPGNRTVGCCGRRTPARACAVEAPAFT